MGTRDVSSTTRYAFNLLDNKNWKTFSFKAKNKFQDEGRWKYIDEPPVPKTITTQSPALSPGTGMIDIEIVNPDYAAWAEGNAKMMCRIVEMVAPDAADLIWLQMGRVCSWGSCAASRRPRRSLKFIYAVCAVHHIKYESPGILENSIHYYGNGRKYIYPCFPAYHLLLPMHAVPRACWAAPTRRPFPEQNARAWGRRWGAWGAGPLASGACRGRRRGWGAAGGRVGACAPGVLTGTRSGRDDWGALGALARSGRGRAGALASGARRAHGSTVRSGRAVPGPPDADALGEHPRGGRAGGKRSPTSHTAAPTSGGMCAAPHRRAPSPLAVLYRAPCPSAKIGVAGHAVGGEAANSGPTPHTPSPVSGRPCTAFPSSRALAARCSAPRTPPVGKNRGCGARSRRGGGKRRAHPPHTVPGVGTAVRRVPAVPRPRRSLFRAARPACWVAGRAAGGEAANGGPTPHTPWDGRAPRSCRPAPSPLAVPWLAPHPSAKIGVAGRAAGGEAANGGPTPHIPWDGRAPRSCRPAPSPLAVPQLAPHPSATNGVAGRAAGGEAENGGPTSHISSPVLGRPCAVFLPSRALAARCSAPRTPPVGWRAGRRLTAGPPPTHLPPTLPGLGTAVPVPPHPPLRKFS
ncbi:hypothetical protein DFH07DRAFT_1008250 [Mycena maculata]|uniref:Uncharacterized protein n=1 Tax=Mycena maculata TaxID=230809 RepID=A0AAD7MKL2_9AGAR|nr:hypothetical protein DFH07DRAFT_1008250 [Mycena maculata]